MVVKLIVFIAIHKMIKLASLNVPDISLYEVVSLSNVPSLSTAVLNSVIILSFSS
jgi:hypothetical protein